MAAFRTSFHGGLIPHAKHGANGLCMFDGSKFEGTALEKEHMGQIQVASLFGAGSAAGRWNGLSLLAGEGVTLRTGVLRLVIARLCVGFGISVIFADDLRNPAYRWH